MAITEAQKRATAKYKAKTKPLQIGFEVSYLETDLREWLENLSEPRATYIKRLIREDIERSKK